MIVQNIKCHINEKLPWLNENDLDMAFDLSLADYLRLSYPSEINRPLAENADIDFYAMQWITARMLDIVGRAGGISAVAYSENQMNWKYGASYMDSNLAKMIIPKAAIPR